MSDSDSIIIKKVKKVSGHGHHGGAWKVAYADFVTAMMAFFLLMWLLNATTEDQRKGIADYFNPTIPVSPISGGGKDVLNGSSVFADDTLAKNGTGGAKTSTSETPDDGKEPTGIEKTGNGLESKIAAATDAVEDTKAAAGKGGPQGQKEALQAALEAIEDTLQAQLSSEGHGAISEHLTTRVSPDGLVIELVEQSGTPLYATGSATPSATMILLLRVVADTFSFISNQISIVGHTDASAFSGRPDYSNWELSSDRAHVARRLLIESGLPASQISEVTGKADTEPLVEDPFAPQNRRISLVLLKS